MGHLDVAPPGIWEEGKAFNTVQHHMVGHVIQQEDARRHLVPSCWLVLGLGVLYLYQAGRLFSEKQGSLASKESKKHTRPPHSSPHSSSFHGIPRKFTIHGLCKHPSPQTVLPNPKGRKLRRIPFKLLRKIIRSSARWDSVGDQSVFTVRTPSRRRRGEGRGRGRTDKTREMT